MWNEFVATIRGDIRRLDSVIRYNSIPVYQRESVASHSFWVSLYSVLLHRTLAEYANDPSLEGDILRHALTHDLGECLTGDVVRTFKYSSESFKQAVDEAESNMIEKYFPANVRGLFWVSDNSNRSRYIHSIVKAADFTSLYMFMNREWIRGNREIKPFIDRMVKDLDSMSIKTRDSIDPFDHKLSSLYANLSRDAFHEPGTREV